MEVRQDKREVIDLHDCAVRLSYVFIRTLSAPLIAHRR